MSILLIDMGNTRIKCASITEAGGPLNVRYFSDLNDLALYSATLEKPDAIWVSSVLSEAQNQKLHDSYLQLWSVPPEFARSSTEAFGVRNAYTEPRRLGVDRWLAMLGAWQMARGAVLVVDAGSALTIDAVDQEGQHLGGWFVPGLALARNSLLEAANFHVVLDEVEIDSSSVFGTSSEQGLLKGTLQSATVLIEHAYSELSRITQEPICYLSGGDAIKIRDTLQCPYIYDEALVLKGLALFAMENS